MYSNIRASLKERIFCKYKKSWDKLKFAINTMKFYVNYTIIYMSILKKHDKSNLKR